MNRFFAPMAPLTLAACMGSNVSTLGNTSTDTGAASSATGSATATGTTTGGTTSSGSTGSATNGNSGGLRVANFLDDVPSLDLIIGNGAEQTVSVRFAEASDGGGAGYTMLSGDTHDVTLGTYGVMSIPVNVGEFQTLFMTGGSAAPVGTTMIDDVSSPGVGMHRMTVWHMSPTAGGADLLVTGFQGTTVSPGAGLTLDAPAGPTSLAFDLHEDSGSGDGSTDLIYNVNLTDGDWSYLYLWHGGNNGTIGRAFHHTTAETIAELTAN
jgi:hypothetical protein